MFRLPAPPLAVALLAGAFAAPSARAAAPVDFSRDVRPILSDKCFHCHGPDEAGRKAKLRLDTREGALRLKDGVAPIVPGKSAESEILHRVTSREDDEVMPPPESKLARLTPAEVDTLRRWIDEGAPYKPHWAFEPLVAPTPPAAPLLAASTSLLSAPNSQLAALPLDRFVAAGLAARGLAFQPEADTATLLRRLAFDLTGLPPTDADVAAYRAAAADPEAALRAYVDRLLASPRYGERMAADWLDVARYADSYGFQVDRERDMWPWRDWVIRAFNANLSWDRFVTWQLAGDLLPSPTDDQRLATAFNRLHAQEAEGGSVEEEYRINYVNDRTTTFGTAFLGLTLECARCHDHKYDPISQKDFYSLAAFFQNIDEAGLYSFFTKSAPTPAMWLPDADHREKFAAATAAVTAAEARLAALRTERRPAFAAWRAQHPDAARDPDDAVARFTFDERALPPPSPPAAPPKAARKASKKASATPASPAGAPLSPAPTPAPATTPPAPPAIPPEDVAVDATLKLPGAARFANLARPADFAATPRENESVTGRPGAGQALRLTGDHPVNTRVGNFHRHDPFTVSLWLQVPDTKERAVVFHRSRAWTDAGSRGYELLLEDGRFKWSLIHFWPGDALSVRATSPAPVGRWLHVAVTNDGSGRAAGLRLFVDGRPAAVEIVRDHLTKDITGGGGDTLALGERFRDRGFTGGLVDDLAVFSRALAPVEIAALAGTAASAEDDLFEVYLARHDEPYRIQLAAVHAARAARTKLADEAKEIMVMAELPAPKPAYILKRGDYDQRGARVAADTPAALPPFPADQPRNRLGLARWLTDPRHPLLARVTVNRFWQSLFGRGLVKTVDDFGSQGDRAEYPELLDWLAADFVRSGWDVKALLRTVVLSRTYRQRSFATPAVMADDPENIWLARGPRHRLPAEMIRDHALAASGLLVEKLGGPPVFTYDIPESFKPAPAGKGEQLYRRSVYTFWRRTGPAPVLEAFDVPQRVVCVARRDTTNTALHALVLLNAPQFVEAARVLAERLHRESAGDPARLLDAGFERLIGRPPADAERAIVARLHAEQLAWFDARPADAEKHLAVGDTPRDAALPAPAIAAAAVVFNTLMNHDAFVVKR